MITTKKTTEQLAVLINSRYQVIDKLGSGGMGIVYRAQDRLTGEMVALKQVLVSPRKFHFTLQVNSTNASLLLAQEFRFLASLRHPHIISVLDYGFDSTRQPFYTMTLMEGAREFTAVAGQRHLYDQTDLLLQMLQALAYLHRQGILHRDLKPANVLVDAKDQVKVVDFGLAVGGQQDNVQGGTLAYMAPEVLRGETAVQQSDLFAVGIMAYELFAGKRPFAADDPIALRYQMLYEPIDFEPLTVDPALVDVVKKLLAPAVEDRYNSAEEVMHAFATAAGRRIKFETQATRDSFLQAARFVGREAELSQLNAALVSAADHKGSVWLIGGESGVGKSRLIDEVQTQALLRGALVLRGQAIAEGGAPYQIWRDAIRRLILQTELSEYEAPILKALIPDIERLIGRPVRDTPHVDVQALQLRMLAVIESIFRQQHHLVVLLLEDLQWADDSLILLKRLTKLASHLPLLIVGTYRNDERPTLPDELPMLHHIKLERLAPESIEQLSISMLGEIGKSPAVVDLLKRETEGNVFFIVEVVRTLAEEAGQLADIGNKTLPAHVFAGGMRTVIQRRWSHVPEAARPLLNMAALVGRELDLKILHHIMPDLNMDDWLQQVSVLVEVQDNRYRFAHDKLREGILTSLAIEQQPAFHKQIAEAIEAVYPDSPELYALLAYHWGQTLEAKKVIHYATLAGQHAQRSGSYREAIKYFEQALALTNQVHLMNVQLSQIYYLLGDAQWGQTDMLRSREAHTHALRLLGYSVPSDNRQLILHTLKPLVRHVGRRLLKLHPEGKDTEALLIVGRAFDQITQGSYHDANITLGLYSILSGMEAAERAGTGPQATRLQSRFYVLFGFAMGDISIEALARFYFSRAQARLRKDADPESQASYDFVYGMHLAGHGQWNESNRLLEEAIELSKVTGSSALWIDTNSYRTFALYLQSRFAEALASIDAPAQTAIRDGHIQAIGRFLTMRSRLQFMLGNTDEARNTFFENETAIQASLEVGDQTVSKIAVYGHLTQLYIRTEEWDSARESAEMLDSLLKHAQTISFALVSEASASIALYLTLWEKESQKFYADQAKAMLKLYHGKATRHYEIGHPIEYTYRSWYAWLAGNEKQARAFGEQAIQAAETYGMTYFKALAHYHLARFMPRTDPERSQHLLKAIELFEQVGAAYDTQTARAAL